MNWLNYHHLYYFYRIAEFGSVSKAAEMLRVGQPTLSTQLKELEERLGILFERRSRALYLTERGKIVLQYATEIFTKGDELLNVLERGELALKRELILGAQEGVPKAIISQTLSRLHLKTKAKLRVVEGTAPILLDNLLEGKIDLVVFDHELSHVGGTVIYLPVGKEKVAFWGASKFKKLAKNFPESMSEAPLILSSTGHPLRQTVEAFFIKHSLKLDIAIEAPDTALTKELARSGDGIVALGESTVRAWVEAGKLYKIGNLPHVQNYSLGLRKSFLKDPISDLVLKEFKTIKGV